MNGAKEQRCLPSQDPILQGLCFTSALPTRQNLRRR